MLHLTACACLLMRMVDLYYVTPWRTGKDPSVGFEDWWVEVWKPFRTIPLTQARLERQEARMSHKGEKQKNVIEDNNDTTPTDPKPMHQKTSGKPVSLTRMQRADPNPQH
ncbi:hypothetical protein BG006_010141 [Podila minutissima]|uniref:Uncharacterized protein n=1 Tax=Podila minutissima TaxID=64525 RepID=A0A9P5SFT9_9FUNG|nr:hypothetical protein BG006_010141 [Podila minutissima]